MRAIVLVVGAVVVLLVVVLETSAWRSRRARRKNRLHPSIWFCIFVVCTLPAFAAEQKADRSWPWLLAAYSAGVAADAETSRRGLEAGGREGNPMLAWAGRDGVVPLRVTAGIVLGCALQELHRTRPRAARRLTWTLTAVSILVAVHNRDVLRRQEAGR